MDPRLIRISDYSYELPDGRIASHPLPDRDESRLLIKKGSELSEDTYRNIAKYLQPGTMVVFNRTKVVHARLLFRKPTGGMIEVFCLAPDGVYTDIQSAMQQKGSVLWECLVGGAAKWKSGQKPELVAGDLRLTANLLTRKQGTFVIGFEWNDPDMSFAEVLHLAGKMPLPPYLNRDAMPEDEQRYQTVFAIEEGSVAAPTAGLHFTERVLGDFSKANIETAFVTLHVGAGTFKPVKADRMLAHDMHEEYIEVEAGLIERLIQQNGKPIVAVGTTSLRTLESLYWIGAKIHAGRIPDFAGVVVGQWDPYDSEPGVPTIQSLQALHQYMTDRKMTRLVTKTKILIAPGYRFRVADGLVTNFHQPDSTLLLLVAAFAGPDWRIMYEYALQNGFRFLSYGDGSLIWR